MNDSLFHFGLKQPGVRFQALHSLYYVVIHGIDIASVSGIAHCVAVYLQ